MSFPSEEEAGGKPSALHKEIMTSQDDDHSPDTKTSPRANHVDLLTEEELEIEKALKKKIDYLIMPLVVLVYLMNYIDRNNYAAAKLQGLDEDLGLSPTEYQTGLSILFVGYVSLPSLPACG